MYLLKNNGTVLNQSPVPWVRHKTETGFIWSSDFRIVQDNQYAVQEWVSDEENELCPDENFFPGEPEPVTKKVLSVIEFKMCFTSAERVAIYTLRDAGDAVVTDWLSILDDPRCTGVDLWLENTRSGVEYLVGKITGFTTDRAAAVLNGEMI